MFPVIELRTHCLQVVYCLLTLVQCHHGIRCIEHAHFHDADSSMVFSRAHTLFLYQTSKHLEPGCCCVTIHMYSKHSYGLTALGQGVYLWNMYFFLTQVRIRVLSQTHRDPAQFVLGPWSDFMEVVGITTLPPVSQPTTPSTVGLLTPMGLLLIYICVPVGVVLLVGVCLCLIITVCCCRQGKRSVNNALLIK